MSTIRRLMHRAASIAIPAVLAFLSVTALWTDPVSRWIGSAAVILGDLFPRGRRWTLPVSPEGPPYFSSWGEFAIWFEASPLPTGGLLAAFAIRLAVCQTVALAMSRMSKRLSARSTAEAAAYIAWALLAALTWRFLWGLQHDRMVANLPHVRICTGMGHIGILWIGALIGYTWSVVQLHRRRLDAIPGEPCCPKCGYSTAGLAPTSTCPECGHDPASPIRGRTGTRAVRWIKRYWPLPVAAVFLAWPYLSTLVSAALPDAWVISIGRNLPAWW